MPTGREPNDRRKDLRSPLALPVRVQGFLADGSTWEQLTTTVDVSEGGACFSLNHEAEPGQVLLLSLPLPKRFRQYDVDDVSYPVYSLVRGVRRKADQIRVGVMFLGKDPPRGFRERPAARYLPPTDSLVNAPVPAGLRPGVPPAPVPGAPPPALEPSTEVRKDRRRAPRVEIFVSFKIELVDEWGAVLQEELTVADNLAKGGARVMSTLGFAVGEVLLLQELGGGFATRAEVRAVTRVQPNVDRLHLRFLDHQAPDRLLK